MPKYEDDYIALLKSKIDVISFIGQYTKLKKQSKDDYVGCCPLHQDDTPSFHVSYSKGAFFCFGCNRGGDIIEFVEQLHNIKFAPAVQHLENYLHINPEVQSQSYKLITPDEPSIKIITPIPDNIKLPLESSPKQVVRYYPYHDENGNIFTYDVRFEELINGKIRKKVLPLCYGQASGKDPDWHWKELQTKTIIYNTHLLTLHSEWDIVIVEGAKCADALQQFFINNNLQLIAVTWRGGCNDTAIKKADWHTVKDRNITIWPDFDWQIYKTGPKKGEIKPVEEQPGYKAGKTITSLLKNTNKSIKFINPLADKPDGWDCYDAIHSDKWDLQQVLSLFGSAVEIKKDSETIEFIEEAPFLFLGYKDGYRFYQDKEKHTIVDIEEKAHSSIMLTSLAPKEFWQSWFPGKGGVDWLGAISYLFHSKYAKHVFDSKKLRGRGAWIDNGRIVLHMGNRLIIDGAETKSVDLQNSDYVYEAGNPINDTLNHPLCDDDAKKLFDIIADLYFASESHVVLLAGFCVLAPICGALEWRPHLWLTGGKGVGKTTIMSRIIKKVIGPFGLFVMGDTTASGIRQTTRLDALTVLFDESEGESKKAKIRLQEVLDLARTSSSETDFKTYKGTSKHQSIEFAPRSMFLFSSIGVNTSQSADESRISVVELIKPRGIQQSILDKKWAELEERISTVLTDDYCSSLRARAIINAKVIRKNSRIFSQAVSEHLHGKREGDQFGTLFAGAFSLMHSGEVTLDSAKDFVRKFDFTTVYENSDDDEMKLLNFILQHTIAISPSKELNIYECLEKIAAYIKNPMSSFDGDNVDSIIDILKRRGIRLDSNENNLQKLTLWIANSHSGIEKILENTIWPKKWAVILKRIPEAQQSKKRYACNPIASTGIPWELVEDRK